MMSLVQPDIQILEDRIGYQFHNTYLLQCALTHTSFAHEQKIHTYDDYERLEFLGDAVLEMVSSAFLYRTYPQMREGEMTKLRSSLVCEPALAYCARDLRLEDFIRLGKGEELCGGRSKDSIISDVCEAVIGAMYLDSGSAVEPEKFIMKYILSDLEGKLLFYDAKSILQEKAQEKGSRVRYELLDEQGPGHEKTFRVAVFLDDVKLADGTGKSKKHAEQQAAFEALKTMTQESGALPDNSGTREKRVSKIN